MRYIGTGLPGTARILGTSTASVTAQYLRFTTVIVAPSADAWDLAELNLFNGGTLLTPTWTRANQTSEAAWNAGLISNSDVTARAAYWGATSQALNSTFYLQADLGSVGTITGFKQAAASLTSGDSTPTAANGTNATTGRWMKQSTITYSTDGTTYTSLGALTFSNPGISILGPLEGLSATGPNFGNSTRGEIGLWNSIAYICTVSGTPGTWVALN